MPNPVNNINNEQWDACQGRCGFVFPISRLTLQKGVKKCFRCLDDLEVERREHVIQLILGEDTNEGVDERWLNEQVGSTELEVE